jgi:hypothetical protein
MPFTDPTFLADVAQDVITGFTAAFTSAGRPVERAVRSDGEPAFDCPGLYVYASTGLVADGLNQDPNPMKRGMVRVGAFMVVTLVRCRGAVPDDRTGVPSAAAVDVDGADLLTDIWVTQRVLIDGLRDGTLVGGGSCTVSHLNPVTPIPPSGGFYGLTTTIDVALG